MPRQPVSRKNKEVGPLADALDKNKQATKSVTEAADELAVIHTVLEAETPRHSSAPEVKQAVAQTKQVERRLNDSVEVLEEVNETLEHEVETRGAAGGTKRG